MVSLFVVILTFFASLVSALFGGGSGLLIVPGIFWLLTHINPPEQHYLMQTTIATSFLLSIPIGLISSLKHYKYGNKDNNLIKKYLHFILLGVVIGLLTLLFIKTNFLKIYFSIMVFSISLWMYFKKPDNLENIKKQKIWPKWLVHFISFLIGFISTTIGASIFIVPFLIKMKVDIRKAIATSTVIVFIYAVIASISLILIGLSLNDLPEDNIGLINLPIFLVGLLPSIIGSLIGTRLANSLPKEKLKLIFVIMMLAVAIIMAIPK